MPGAGLKAIGNFISRQASIRKRKFRQRFGLDSPRAADHQDQPEEHKQHPESAAHAQPDGDDDLSDLDDYGMEWFDFVEDDDEDDNRLNLPESPPPNKAKFS